MAGGPDVPDVEEVAVALQESIGQFVRRLRQVQPNGGLSSPERSALRQLELAGPTAPGALAKLEQITPQSVGETLVALAARGLVQRQPDPGDGRRVLISLTEAGRQALREKRTARSRLMAQALATEFTSAELNQLWAAAPLVQRLADRI